MNSSKENPLENFKITGNWTDQSKKLKEKYSQLTDEDLKFENGKENDLFKRVESRLKKGRQEVINIIKKVQPSKA
ncbi:general stress protein CsbD [Membranihabitans maritimus]|uniref:general stress protein CsbD n=1 Tax=Membranihabitans maritimus TaxID=2904244 RepID=UPI001F2244B7|nr:general stress protein CsbD [Membranihabitans maritimus]